MGEPLLYRNEAVAVMWAIFDTLEEVRAIRLMLEDDDGEEEDDRAEDE